jgi:hypothetical protein
VQLALVVPGNYIHSLYVPCVLSHRIEPSSLILELVDLDIVMGEEMTRHEILSNIGMSTIPLEPITIVAHKTRVGQCHLIPRLSSLSNALEGGQTSDNTNLQAPLGLLLLYLVVDGDRWLLGG